jgi:hypothetical protein
MKIYAPLSALHTVACFAAKDDIRYYLNAVRVEASPVQTRFTATDGHCAGMLRTAQDNEDIDGAVAILLPIDIVKAAKKAKNNCDALVIETADGKSGTLAVVGGVSINWTAIDGNYPTMARVIPAQASGEPAQFNPELIAKFAQAQKIASGSKTAFPHFWHNGTNGTAVTLCGQYSHDFTGVIMPLREEKDLTKYADYRAPTWALEDVAQVIDQAQAAA